MNRWAEPPSTPTPRREHGGVAVDRSAWDPVRGEQALREAAGEKRPRDCQNASVCSASRAVTLHGGLRWSRVSRRRRRPRTRSTSESLAHPQAQGQRRAAGFPAASGRTSCATGGEERPSGGHEQLIPVIDGAAEDRERGAAALAEHRATTPRRSRARCRESERHQHAVDEGELPDVVHHRAVNTSEMASTPSRPR